MMLIALTWFTSRNYYNAKATERVFQLRQAQVEENIEELERVVDDIKPMEDVYTRLEAEAMQSPYAKFD